mmetsp:Transcript_22301/g.53499  ORF Transcript_22301/g.53499 Transcript_22301/m.53499 type:complete len:231 (-) Transcript_22301:710-1402(-)
MPPLQRHHGRGPRQEAGHGSRCRDGGIRHEALLRPCRRLRAHHPVELPHAHGHMEGSVSARGRQRHHSQALGAGAFHVCRPRFSRVPGGVSSGRVQRRHWVRRGGGRAALHARGRRQGRLHWVGSHRGARHAGVCTGDPQHLSRTGGEIANRCVSGRAGGRGGRVAHVRHLLDQRTDLLGDEPGDHPRGHAPQDPPAPQGGGRQDPSMHSPHARKARRGVYRAGDIQGAV